MCDVMLKCEVSLEELDTTLEYFLESDSEFLLLKSQQVVPYAITSSDTPLNSLEFNVKELFGTSSWRNFAYRDLNDVTPLDWPTNPVTFYYTNLLPSGALRYQTPSGGNWKCSLSGHSHYPYTYAAATKFSLRIEGEKDTVEKEFSVNTDFSLELTQNSLGPGSVFAFFYKASQSAISLDTNLSFSLV